MSCLVYLTLSLPLDAQPLWPANGTVGGEITPLKVSRRRIYIIFKGGLDIVECRDPLLTASTCFALSASPLPPSSPFLMANDPRPMGLLCASWSIMTGMVPGLVHLV